MIKGVVFDFDHTLYDRDRSDQKAVGSLFDTEPWLFCEGVTRDMAVDAIVPAAHRFIHKGWHAVCDCLSQEGILTDRVDSDHFCDQIQRQLFTQLVNYPFIDDMFAQLRGMGMKLGLITNGREFYQRGKLNRSGLEPAFDYVLIGSDPATAKPHPDLFWKMADFLGCEPSKLLYVGDNPKNDVDASRRAGYIPVWVRTITPWDYPDIEPCPLQVDSVSQIPALVRRLLQP